MSDKALYGKCIDSLQFHGLTEGKVYRLREIPHFLTHYSIVDDYGDARMALKARFEVTTVASPEYAESRQVGGTHYQSKAIQPIDYIMANSLDFCEGNVVKYVTRYRDKGGIEDLKKARHYLDFLIEREEKKNESV